MVIMKFLWKIPMDAGHLPFFISIRTMK